MSDSVSVGLWYRRSESTDGGLFSVSSHFNDRHPDGATVYAKDEPSVANEVWRTRSTEAGLLHIHIEQASIPSAPPVWFVFVPEPTAKPAAVNLVAYLVTDESYARESQLSLPPAGTVISARRFASLRVPNDAQVAAVRWYPHDGLLHQVYVQQRARRQSLGTVMIYAASAVHQSHGWPGIIHGDGRRTELGEKFVAGLRHPQRFAPLAETQPPMD